MLTSKAGLGILLGQGGDGAASEGGFFGSLPLSFSSRRYCVAEMEVNYITHMGDDKLVVNAARVSMGKQVKEFRPEQDGRLLRYLAKHKHELPFAHPHVTFHFKAPIFVARQLG